MLKDLIAESAKQFEERFGVNGPIDNTYTMGCDCHPKTEQILAFLAAQISSAFAIGEESGIQKAVEKIKKKKELLKIHSDPRTEGAVCVICLEINILSGISDALQSNLTTHKE